MPTSGTLLDKTITKEKGRFFCLRAVLYAQYTEDLTSITSGCRA